MAAEPDDRILVGYVRRAHGIRGDVLVRNLSDDPDRFVVGAQFMTDEDPPRHLEVTEVRAHKDGVLLSLGGITDRAAADAMRGASLTIEPSQRRQLGEDEFWPDDLQGLDVYDSTGEHLGTMSAVLAGSAQDRLVVSTPNGRDIEVPFVAAIVTEVDIAGGAIHMDPPPGLFSD